MRHDAPVDQERVQLLRDVLAGTGWIDRSRGFARALRRSTANSSDGLLLVGTPTDEPWHLAAHLDDESRWADLPGLSPTLVRWHPPANAPHHLAVGLDRLGDARRGDTVFVVAPDDPTEPLLERIADARRSGATIMSLDFGHPDLNDLTNERLIVPASGLIAPGEHSGLMIPLAKAALLDVDLSLPAVSFETVQHLVSAAAGEPDTVLRAIGTATAHRGFRDRLGRLLDQISGPAASQDW
jgi:hypothetical protein